MGRTCEEIKYNARYTYSHRIIGGIVNDIARTMYGARWGLDLLG